MAEAPQDIKEQAAKSAAKAGAKRAQKDDPDGPRTRPGALNNDISQSDIEVNLDSSQFGPQAFAASVSGDITGYADSQEFTIDEDKAVRLYFASPGQRLPKKNSYRVKAFHKDGRLVQLAFEPQIQNTAGGSPEDAIGLRRYQNKGMTILFDFQTMLPIYCAAFDCWAKAREGDSFCCDEHRNSTIPTGRTIEGVTTSRVWNG